MKKLLIIIIAILISACGGGSKLDGTYASDYHTKNFTFNQNGTVNINSGDKKLSEYKYHIDGNKIVIEGTVYQFTLSNDGVIDGGAAYGKLVKK